MSRAQQQLHVNWVGIVVEVLSIIQGLAFNDLVSRFPDIYDYWLETGDYRIIIHFLLCFVLLLRIFQTYLTAALDYNLWAPRLFDVLIIFIIGALEYFVFASLTVPDFDIARFHRRLSLISLFGIVGYLGAVLRIQEELFPAYREYKKEVRLQISNLAGVFMVLAASILVIIFPQMNTQSQTALAGLATAALCFNIFYSLRKTFSARAQVTTLKQENRGATPADNTNPDIDIILRPAEREDVDELCSLFVQHFGYFYAAVFDASVRLTRRIVRRILLINWGRHPLGYRTFYVACESNTGRVVGLFMLKTRESDSLPALAAGTIRLALTVLRHLGMVGLVRTARNLRAVGAALPSIKPDELRIVYLAVRPEARRRKVGSQVIEFARTVARSRRKEEMTLEVREANGGARKFFQAHGFVEFETITTPGDALLDRGARIRMSAKV